MRFRDQLLQWFEQNPDEELTHDDAAIKFGRSRKQAEDVMRELGHDKLIGYRFDQAGPIRTKLYMRYQ